MGMQKNEIKFPNTYISFNKWFLQMREPMIYSLYQILCGSSQNKLAAGFNLLFNTTQLSVQILILASLLSGSPRQLHCIFSSARSNLTQQFLQSTSPRTCSEISQWNGSKDDNSLHITLCSYLFPHPFLSSCSHRWASVYRTAPSTCMLRPLEVSGLVFYPISPCTTVSHFTNSSANMYNILF